MEPKNPSNTKALFRFFGLAFGFSWFFWLFAVLSSVDLFSTPVPTMVWVVAGAHGPLFAAILLTYKSGGWAAVKQLIRSGLNLRMKAGWWLAILLTPVVLTGVAVWLNITLNGYQTGKTLLAQPLLILPTFVLMFFLGGSFQEEFGWRGYALPRLLESLKPLTASVLLGGIWGLWHLPLFHVAGTSQVFMPFGVFIVLAILMSIFFTYFYLRTGKNLFSALLFHASVNTSLSLFPPVEQKAGGNYMALVYLVLFYLCLVIVIALLDRTFSGIRKVQDKTAP